MHRRRLVGCDKEDCIGNADRVGERPKSVAVAIGVCVPPGATQLTRIGDLMNSMASDLVKLMTAAFEAQYAAQ